MNKIGQQLLGLLHRRPPRAEREAEQQGMMQGSAPTTRGLRPEHPGRSEQSRGIESYQVDPQSVLSPGEYVLDVGRLDSQTAKDLATGAASSIQSVRCFIRNSQGYGDQNAMQTALFALHQLGFKGHVECVLQDLTDDELYFDMDGMLIKLMILFKEVDPEKGTSQSFEWKGMTVQLIAESDWDAYLDGLPEESRKADLRLSAIYGGRHDESNISLNTRTHCIMQPYLIREERRVTDGEAQISLDFPVEPRYRPVYLQELVDLRTGFKDGASGDELWVSRKVDEFVAVLKEAGFTQESEISSFKVVVKDLLLKRRHLQLTYGLHHPYVQEKAPVILRNLTGSLAERLDHSVPPVVMVVGKVIESEDWLAPDSIVLLHTDEHFLDVYQKAGHGGKTVVLNFPFLPKKAFEFLTAISHYPVLLEGANTTNLVQNLGVPYLSVLPEGYTPLPPFSGVQGPDEYRALEAMKLASEFLSRDKEDSLNVILGFLNAAAAEEPGYKALFERLRQEAMDPRSDQVLYMMAAYGLLKQKASTPLLKKVL